MNDNELKKLKLGLLAAFSIPLLVLGYFLYSSVCSHIADYMAENRTVVRGESGQKFKTYQECCYANDFNAAHVYLARVKQVSENGFIHDHGNTNYRIIYEEGKSFVFRQESAYLLSTGEQSAKQRVLYLIMEEEASDEMIGELVEIAIDCDDVPFAMTLFDKQSKHDFSLIQKATEHLAKGNDEKQLLDFVKSIPIIGSKPALGHKPHISDDEYNYMKSISAINNACDVALEYAINQGNKEMSQSVLKLYKTGIDWFWGGDDIKKNNKYYSKSPTGVLVEEHKAYIWSDNNSKNAAQARFNQAVKNRMFH